MKKGAFPKKIKVRKKKAKHRITKVIHESTKEIKVDRSLTDNFIALQRVMVNLSLKFDSLSTQISKLLELFEISAKNLARKDLEANPRNPQTSLDVKNIQDKLDNLASQAGLIGRGLSLIHEVNSEKVEQVKKQISPQTNIRSRFPVKTFVNEMPQTKNLVQRKPVLEEISSELAGYEKSDKTLGNNEKEMP